MAAEVQVAIVGAIPALITAIVTVSLNNSVTNVKLEALQQQFDRIEEKVDKHNNFMERLARLEEKTRDLT